MSSNYRKTVEKLAEQSGLGDRSPCLRCDTPTLRETLSQYGARCFGCYEAYCAEGVNGGAKGFAQGRPDTPTQAEMRRGQKPKGLPVNVLAKRDDVDSQAIARAKAETARKVEQYARDKGIELEPRDTGDQSRARFSGAVR